MKILNFGSLNIDKVYQVKDFVRPGETISSKKLEFFCGGKGLNQSIAISRAGAPVYHAGCIGYDGDMLSDALTASHIHTEYLKKLEIPTGHAIIQVSDTGQNCIILFGGANQAITESQIRETLSHFSAGDILLLQNEINHLALLIEQAFEKGMQIYLNPSPVTEQLKEISLDKISCLILNEIEAADLCASEWEKQKQAASSLPESPKECARALHSLYPGLQILLTMGTGGSIFLSGQKFHFQEAFPVNAVDTTAAGDTFTGYFIAAVSRGDTAEAAMEESAKASAIAVTRAGASASIPLREEVLAWK